MNAGFSIYRYFTQYILVKKRKSIHPEKKIIITKNPLHKVVTDGLELDKVLKHLTGFNRVIDIIEHFSKILMSIPAKIM